MSGKKVAAFVLTASLAIAALLLVARMSYRGEHDTAEKLGLPLRDGGGGMPVPERSKSRLTANVDHAEPESPAVEVVAARADDVDASVVVATAAVTPSVRGGSDGSQARPSDVAAPVDHVAPASTTRTTEARPAETRPTEARPTEARPTETRPTEAPVELAPTEERASGATTEESPATRAAEAARKATESDPTSADAWLTLGGAYQALGRKAQAMDAYRSCVKLAQGARVAECRALASLD